jgi:hypothetical protein
MSHRRGGRARGGARLRCLIAPLRFGCDWTGLRPCVAARARIVDAEENRYYLSLEGDLYLYVGSPEPENRFLLCPLDRCLHELTSLDFPEIVTEKPQGPEETRLGTGEAQEPVERRSWWQRMFRS